MTLNETKIQDLLNRRARCEVWAKDGIFPPEDTIKDIEKIDQELKVVRFLIEFGLNRRARWGA